MLKDRNVIAHIIKTWAQDHDPAHAYQIAIPEVSDDAVDKTAGHFSWLIKETPASIDLLTLVDRLELYFDHIHSKKYKDGMFCRKCRDYCPYAEPNQADGTMLCHSCRNNPYH